MIRLAQPPDASAIEQFLAPYADTSMFLRGNREAHGLGQSDLAHSTDFHLRKIAGMLRAVFGLTRDRYLLAQAPDDLPDASDAFAKSIAGRQVQGMPGIAVGDLSLNKTEPRYRLDLAELDPGPAVIRAPDAGDVARLTDWFRDYVIETNTVPGGETATQAARRRAEGAPHGPLSLMIENGVSTATAALNAHVADMVQLGGVYGPSDLRRAGRGRPVLAAHLADARDKGARAAILFAASQAVARAYEAIGFCLIGNYKLALLRTPLEVV
ncbi:MAG: hypothetical protein AAGA70_02335 [Pseudomonadota bacterium]